MVEWILLVYVAGAHPPIPITRAPFHHYATEALCEEDARVLRGDGQWEAYCKAVPPNERKP